MAKVYASIRGAQGVAPGVIVPFSKECQSDANLLERVPGGYLRCDGKIYQARDYPGLAKVIGVGPSGGNGIRACPFPPGVAGAQLINPTLDADGNFTAGSFAVPNLGAKVLLPNTSAGQQFIGNSVGGSIYERAGVGYVATILPTVNTTISGNIIDSEKTQSISGNGTFSYRDGATTSTAYIDLQRTAAHGHGDTWYQSDMRDQDFDTNLQDDVSIDIIQYDKTVTTITHNGANITHNHTISGGTCSNSLEYTRSQTTISFSGSSATANVTADPKKSLDHLTTPYIIVEYIIKI